MKTLFDSAVERVLDCPELIKIGVPLLPRRVVQHMLCLCCRDTVRPGALTHIIQYWPHQEFTLCASDLIESCLSPQEYHSNPALHRDSFTISYRDLHLSIPSIAKGLFLHFSQPTPCLGTVNLSSFVLKGENLNHMLKLARGEYPVSHPSDYVSKEDLSRVYRQSPPVLPHSHTPPRLIISVELPSPSQVDSILELYSSKYYFKVEISGCDLSLLRSSHVPRLLSAVQNKCLSNLSVHLSHLPVIVQKCDHLPLSSRTSLSLVGDQSLQVSHHLRTLLSRCAIRMIIIDNQYAVNHPSCLIDPLTNISSFSLLGVNTKEADQNLEQFIDRNCSSLEYFEVNACLTLLPQCVRALRQCAALRVLSVTQKRLDRRLQIDCSPDTIFSTIGSLASLEYFEWKESIALRTRDLVALYETLSHRLPRLRHLHLHGFTVLVSTPDLDNPQLEAIMELLLSLLTGKEGDESVCTYKFQFSNDTFKHFIGTVRPDVCFCAKPF